MAQSMKKEIRKTFGFAREKFSAKVRLHTKMPGVPIILSKSVCVYVAQLVRVCSWRLATSGTFESEFACVRESHIHKFPWARN